VRLEAVLICHFFCHYGSGLVGFDETKGNWWSIDIAAE